MQIRLLVYAPPAITNFITNEGMITGSFAKIICVIYKKSYNE